MHKNGTVIENARYSVNAKPFGLLVAAAVSQFLANCVTSPPKGSPAEIGMCHGANSCRALGKCGGKGSSCAGKNACKGHGWIKLTRGECETAKGRFSTEWDDDHG